MASVNVVAVLHTVGANSGPSNVDGFTGYGGVHRRTSPTSPPGGNPMAFAVINAELPVISAGRRQPHPAPAKALGLQGV